MVKNSSLSKTETNTNDLGGSDVVALPQPEQESLQTRFGWLKQKKVIIPTALVVVLAIIFTVPISRYAVAGILIKREVSIIVLDSQTKQPLSGASVSLKSATVVTDNDGKAQLRVKVGPGTVTISKKYYASDSQKLTVPLNGRQEFTYPLKATGRLVAVTVSNKIDGKPVNGAVLSIEGMQAKADSKGMLTIALSADKTSVPASVKADGYLDVKADIKVTDDPKANVIALVPEGKIFFLSNLNGKPELVKTNFDGSARATVVNGNEYKSISLVEATKDGRFVSFVASKDGKSTRTYVLDAETSKISVVGAEDHVVTFRDWHGHRLIFIEEKDGVDLWSWPMKRQKISSYNADSGQTKLLDQSVDQPQNPDKPVYGRVYSSFRHPNMLNGELYYTVHWEHRNAGEWLQNFGKLNTLRAAQLDGSGTKDYMTFDPRDQVDYSPQAVRCNDSVILTVTERSHGSRPRYFEFKGGASKQVTAASFDGCKSYVRSPSGGSTLLNQLVDGKNNVSIGDAAGNNGKRIVRNYYGLSWIDDKYVLLRGADESNRSTLYVVTSGGGTPLQASNFLQLPQRSEN